MPPAGAAERSASPPQLTNPDAADYGYRSNVNAAIERLRRILSR